MLNPAEYKSELSSLVAAIWFISIRPKWVNGEINPAVIIFPPTLKTLSAETVMSLLISEIFLKGVVTSKSTM